MGDTTGYENAKPIIFPTLDNLLWGIVKSLQYYSLGFMVIAIVAIGLMLVFSGDNTHKKSSLMGWGTNILIGATLIFGATVIAGIVKQFVGGS